MMTVEPKRILCGSYILAKDCEDSTMEFSCLYVNRHDCAELAEALTHFAKTGRFCDPPPKPIEWVEHIPGKVWSSGDWLIRPYADITQWVAQNLDKNFSGLQFTSAADARAYAESQIRKEAT